MEIEVIAQKREMHGTSASRRLRHSGFVPGIVYGGTVPPLAIQLDHNALFHALRKEAFHASVLNLKIGNISETALLRDVQWHPYKPQVLHVDFQRINANETIHVKVPLHFLNDETAPGVKIGHGLVNRVITELDIECLPAKLPEFIAVDIGALEVGDHVLVNDIKLPAGVVVIAHLAEENPVVVAISPPIVEGVEKEGVASAEAGAEAKEGGAESSDSKD